jgi:hypothetical protein
MKGTEIKRTEKIMGERETIIHRDRSQIIASRKYFQ